jgi:uncharacterized spore protein YtfJ
MAEVEELVKATLGEIERILSTKTVVGEPMTVGGNTIIPLVSIGFAFGGGGGSGGQKDSGSGAGGGGGVRPVGVVVVTEDGVKVEPIRGRMAGVVEAVTEGIGQIAERRRDRKKEAKKEKEE